MIVESRQPASSLVEFKQSEGMSYQGITVVPLAHAVSIDYEM